MIVDCSDQSELVIMAEAAVPMLQLIDQQGNFNQTGLDSFVKTIKLAECGLSYAVVSIMGPQSSGKSTLFNHLFGTRFREMDAFKGRNQTTQGVWLAKAADIEPCTLVVDMEGTDGRERGEDDTTFEKQSSLFALAVSDIMIINIWCHDIGRDHATNKPLLKTVFQVMLRLFTPRKTTLLFVIRDKTKTPLEILDQVLREDLEKIWDEIPKPAKYPHTPLAEFFHVEVTALPSYETNEDLFKEQVGLLKRRFYQSIAPEGLAGDRRNVIPGTGFPISTQEMWKVIKENKDLDLPAHKIMVATVRCEQIANEKFTAFTRDEEWKSLFDGAKAGPVPTFGRRLSVLLDRYLSAYDAETTYFERSVRDGKREFLVSQCLELVQPAYQAILAHYRLKAFSKFKQDLELSSASSEVEGFARTIRHCMEDCFNEFDQACADAYITQAGWDPSKVREKLRQEVEAHAAAVKSQRLGDIAAKFEQNLENALGSSVASLFDAASPDTWPAIRKRLSHETDVARTGLSEAVSGFELQHSEEQSMLGALTGFGRKVVERRAREAASQVLIRMKDRFTIVFSHDPDSLPRVWSGGEDIRRIAKDARLAALKLLALLAVLRLEGNSNDTVEATLTTLLEVSDNRELPTMSSASNSLAASSWEGVGTERILITPVECMTIWRQFNVETEYTIAQALAAQEASKRAVSWRPPLWTIVAMVVLGFNEFMAVARNPLYLALVFVLYLVGRALWVQLDIGREFGNGMLAGTLSIMTKLLPTFMNIMKRLVDEGHRLQGNRRGYSPTDPSSRNSTAVSANGPQLPGSSIRQRQQTKVSS